MASDYDVIIIGAGMSGMAAGIRLSMFGKKTLLLEKHSISGGLNSYYQRGKRPFDVGLHALTNFATKGERRRPLTKLLKQLRVPYDELNLSEQSKSQIAFPERSLDFTNEIDFFIENIHKEFPDQVDGFRLLLNHIEGFNETALDNEYLPAKEVVRKFISNEELLEMIFCPLLIYGSAFEDDMDFSQFVIMFKSIFLEGFARPEGGVRSIVNILLNKLEESGCETRFKVGVSKILTEKGKASGVLTTKNEIIKAPLVLSCAGLPETMSLLDHSIEQSPRVGKMSFTETILCLKQKPRELGQDKTIIFANKRPQYHYRRPSTLIDSQSAVICLPNNFKHDDSSEGIVRLTFMANYHEWASLSKPQYKEEKEKVLEQSVKMAQQYLPEWDGAYEFKDVFSPTTITRYTGHIHGTVYGSTDKSRDGKTPIEGLCICGTDQGFLGIVGSMLSGISMANLHGLMDN